MPGTRVLPWTTLCIGCSLLLASCAPNGLGPLLVADGKDLHPSLTTRSFESASRGALVPHLKANPQLSTDSGFVEIIARMGSQDRVTSGKGIRAALHAIYSDPSGTAVGLYGLEAATTADADRIEVPLRAIWSRQTTLERTRVVRRGKILVVAWNDGVSPECWEAVNAGVWERLGLGAPQR